MGHKPIKDLRCGMRRSYQLGCRCAVCVAANAAYQRRYRARGAVTVRTESGASLTYREQTLPFERRTA